MTDTTVTTAAPSTVATPTSFTAKLSADFTWLESDVVSLIQNIGAGLEVVADDITGGLTWLGSHLGVISGTIQAVQVAEASLNSAGVPLPSVLVNGINAINNAVTGVNEALTNQAVAANGGQALTLGYQAAKTLQIAAASAAAVASGITASLTAPVATVTPASS